MPSTTSQARYWLLTIPTNANYTPFLDIELAYLKGQQERGHTTGYEHWQLLAVFKKKVRRRTVKQLFGETCHAEPTRSSAANEYVWKEDTRIPDTQFELGTLPINRGVSKDWDAIKEAACSGRLDSIPSDVYVRNYNTLKRISVDHCKPVASVENPLAQFLFGKFLSKSLSKNSALRLNIAAKTKWAKQTAKNTTINEQSRGQVS